MNFFRQLVNVNRTITRPADAVAYAAGDIIGSTTDVGTSVSVLVLTAAARANGIAGFISSAVLIDSINAATNIDLDVFFFDTAPAQQADNVAFAPTDAEMNRCLGVGTLVGTDGKEAAGSIAYNILMPSPGKIDFLPLAASQDIYACLVVRNAYNPTSGEIFNLRTWIYQA